MSQAFKCDVCREYHDIGGSPDKLTITNHDDEYSRLTFDICATCKHRVIKLLDDIKQAPKQVPERR